LHVGAFAGGLAAAEKRYENGQKKDEAVSHKSGLKNGRVWASKSKPAGKRKVYGPFYGKTAAGLQLWLPCRSFGTYF
jgi:hypothetical protein